MNTSEHAKRVTHKHTAVWMAFLLCTPGDHGMELPRSRLNVAYNGANCFHVRRDVAAREVMWKKEKGCGSKRRHVEGEIVHVQPLTSPPGMDLVKVN